MCAFWCGRGRNEEPRHLPVYEFECENGHVTEAKGRWGETHVLCPQCNLVAVKRAVPRHPPTVIGATCTKLEYQK